MCCSSWDEIKKDTISNCFHHTGFFKAKCSEETLEKFDSEDEHYKLSQEFNRIFPEFDEYISIDNNWQLCAPLEEEFIPEDFNLNKGPKDNDIDDSEDTEEIVESEPKIQRFEIMKLINDCKKYALQNNCTKFTEDLLNCANKMEKCLFSETSNFVQ